MAAFMATAPAADAGAATAATCERCAHEHSELERCGVCAHFGREVIFPGEHDRQPPTATFKTEARYVNQDPIPQSYSHYRLGSIIRTKVFIEERYVPAPDPHIPMTVGVEESAASGRRKETSDRDEFDEPDKHARHVLGKVGDAPVSYARWRLVTLAELGLPSTNGGDPTQQYVGLIDRLAVLPSYRLRGYGAATLRAVFNDIALFMVSRNVLLERISIFIHYSTLGLGAARTAAKLGMVAYGDRHAADPSHFYNPTFIGDVGVQEFTTTAQALLSVVGISGDGADAAGAAAASTI